ncbi:MAG: hypothetical protein U0270_28050 [Labilithrix sp.]
MKLSSNHLRFVVALLIGAVSWVGGCSASSKDGVTVTVTAEAPRDPPLTAGARAFDTSAGLHVTVTRAFLNTGAVEIFACPTAHRWLGLTVREARAHVVGSPTLLGTPLVASLLAEDGARTNVGELHPPPGSYCRVKQSILPADADAPGSPADGAMLGRSLLVEGTFGAPGEAPRPFRLTSTAAFDVETTVDPMVLSVEGHRVGVVVLFWKSAAWFDGVDLAAAGDDAATRLLANLRASLGARVE